ncbi:hypothetical protein EPI10_001321 [Gossypium australe]|uniref:Uncharacterized protein n=1 Tax=Gossypium australe TaxID=47621 RepID=A0A5B6VAI9_9ROSI|nr:hypothetical protein EPI10_001321 [Gossypium australe]
MLEWLLEVHESILRPRIQIKIICIASIMGNRDNTPRKLVGNYMVDPSEEGEENEPLQLVVKPIFLKSQSSKETTTTETFSIDEIQHLKCLLSQLGSSNTMSYLVISVFSQDD